LETDVWKVKAGMVRVVITVICIFLAITVNFAKLKDGKMNILTLLLPKLLLKWSKKYKTTDSIYCWEKPGKVAATGETFEGLSG
jgi:hypothetical protein